jgi:hypothetical protein
VLICSNSTIYPTLYETVQRKGPDHEHTTTSGEEQGMETCEAPPYCGKVAHALSVASGLLVEVGRGKVREGGLAVPSAALTYCASHI